MQTMVMGEKFPVRVAGRFLGKGKTITFSFLVLCVARVKPLQGLAN